MHDFVVTYTIGIITESDIYLARQLDIADKTLGIMGQPQAAIILLLAK